MNLLLGHLQLNRRQTLLLAQRLTKSLLNTTQTVGDLRKNNLLRSTAISGDLFVPPIILSRGSLFLTHTRTSFSLRSSCRPELPTLNATVLSRFSESASMARAVLHL